MVKKLTAFTSHFTAEGMRIAYTFSTIDDNGDVVKSNERATCIVMDEQVLAALGTVNSWLQERIQN